jgi:hypothetical protein
MHDFAERLSVSRLRALFFDLRNPNEYREVVVKPAHVELLNRGAQPANLLTTVEVSRGSYNRTMTVSPGILLGERTKLRDLLLRLKRNGKDISDVAAKYSRLEQLVKSGAKRESISEVCNEAFLDASILTTQAQKKYAIPKRMTLRQNGLTFNYMDDWKLVKPSDNQCFAQLDRWDGPICSRIQIRECLEASVVEPATKNWHLHFRNHDYWVGTIKLAKFGNCETGLFDLRKPNEAEPNLETMLYFGEHGRIYCFHLLYDTRVRTTIFPMVVSMISNSTIAPNPSATE